MKIAFCQSTFNDDFEDTKLCIERVSPHVDFTVIAFDGTITDEQLKWLYDHEEKYNIHTAPFVWTDDMPAMRNAYLEAAKNLGADWVAVSDPDELYSEGLSENLRSLVEQYDSQGFNLLPIPARDQFETVEWLDELDLLKETPGGYRETDFWKPLLLFKVYPDLHYEGVGAEGKVHEMLKSSTPWKPCNLPKEFYYTHRKSALRIWRNAARNMFIGGGGDNVGQLNQYWVDLRGICTRLDLRCWNDFEDFVKTGGAVGQFKDWLLLALQAPPTNWGTETRETAKWYYALHHDEVTPEVKEALENPPEMTPEIEVGNYVTRCYFQVLGRHPDAAGKEHYTQLILSGEMDREDLPTELRKSPEFKQKFAPTGPVERVKMQVPVDVNIKFTEDLIVEVMKRSGIYWESFKPKIDVGGFILSKIKKKDELLKWFYENKDNMRIHSLASWILDNAQAPNSVALCIMGYSAALPMIIESIEVMHSYIQEIHVLGDDFTEEDVERLGELGAYFHIEPWVDEFSDYKNKCIAPANTEWVLILDHDEIPTAEMAAHLDEIITKSEDGRKFNLVQFDVIDTKTQDGEVISENVSPGGKPLLHWNVPEPYYGNPHIWLKPNYYPWKQIHVSYAYRHVKKEGTELSRSARNVFLGGGGDNTREGNPLWVELRTLTAELDIDTWKRFDEYLKAGDIDPKLLDIMKRLKEMPWKDSELGDPLKYYQQLHPEEFE